LFLDEVTDLPLAAQAKLLRVLQDRELRPVGSDRLIPVDVRLVAATNRAPELEVEAGRFRSDLYYRLRVIELELPPLRERPEDIHELLDAQLHRFNAILGRDIRGFSPTARRALEAYPWPGNVRELKNVLERAVLLHELGALRPSHFLPGAGAGPTPTMAPAESAPAGMSLADMEREHIGRVLAACGGNRTKTADALGIGISTLRRKLKDSGTV
jgi:transcriptional regulator with PAS, ATPase and Fis domain